MQGRLSSNDEEVFLRRLNDLRSKTSALPPEVLSLIFQHASMLCNVAGLDAALVAEPSKNILLPIFLGSISHTWRQVAWSTPQLWTTLFLVVPPDKAQNSASLLDLYLTNVRGLVITLHIEFDDYYPPSEDDPVGRVFFKEEHLRKLGALKISQPPTSWLRLFNCTLSQLVEIHLDHNDKAALPANIAFLTNAPRLNKISFERMHPPFMAPWPSITILRLEDVSAAAAVRCLLHCPNLIEFHHAYAASNMLEDDDDDDHEGSPVVPSLLVVHHLEILQWSFTSGHASDLFLRRTRFPALRCLTWEHFADIFPSGICTFFRNLSSAPLTTLWLRGMFDMNITLIKHIYHQNSRIENLLLEDFNEETLRVALASLIPGWNGKGQADEKRYLTKLKMLEIRGYISDGEYSTYPLAEVLEASFGDLIADLLIGRAGPDFGSGLCINLVFNKMAKVTWRPKTKEKLRDFSRTTGVKLFEDGKKLDWLQSHPYTQFRA